MIAKRYFAGCARTLAVLLTAFLYTLVYLLLRLGGGLPSTFAPWLNILRKVYNQAFFVLFSR